MKIACDLCGGQLEMSPGGQSATCVNCGLEHSRQRLMEKLNGTTTADPIPVEEPAKPQMRNLFLKRKFNLSGCAAKAVFFLDGTQCAVLGAKGEVSVPICEGEHEIVVRLVGPVVTEFDKVVFQVKDRDIMGTFYLHQTAFTGQWAFDLVEL